MENPVQMIVDLGPMSLSRCLNFSLSLKKEAVAASVRWAHLGCGCGSSALQISSEPNQLRPPTTAAAGAHEFAAQQ